MKEYLEYLKNIGNLNGSLNDKQYLDYTKYSFLTWLPFGFIPFVFIMTPGPELATEVSIWLIIILFYVLTYAFEIRRFKTLNKSTKIYNTVLVITLIMTILLGVLNYYYDFVNEHSYLLIFLWVPQCVTNRKSIFKRKGEI